MPSKRFRSKAQAPKLPPVSEPEVIENTVEPVEEPVRMKYARRDLVGRPQLGKTHHISSVGLGNLRVETAHGYDDV
jgi:hypothetical protein